VATRHSKDLAPRPEPGPSLSHRVTEAFSSGWRWRVVRTSNAYVLRDPLGKVATNPAGNSRFPSKSENPPGTMNQLANPTSPPPDSPLESALAALGALIPAKDAYEGRR
jgi:hypothetical protein